MKSKLPARMVVGLVFAAIVPFLALGCGDSPKIEDAVVVPDSTAPPPAPVTPPPAAKPAPATEPVKAEGWGTLKGRVVFGGTPPAIKILQEKGKAAKDPNICAVDAPIMSERLVVDSATKGVKNVLVYLAHPTAINEAAKTSAKAARVVFDQRKCLFEPHVLGVMAGVVIDIRSNDAANHNVNAKLKFSSFNQIIAQGQSFKFTPTSAERLPGLVVCDIHPWMSAWWMILDHPYFAVTDAKGAFEIMNAPAGTQKLVVWQEAAGFVTAPAGDDIVVKAGEAVVKDLTIDPGKIRQEG